MVKERHCRAIKNTHTAPGKRKNSAIYKAVERTVKEYGEALRRLGRE